MQIVTSYLDSAARNMGFKEQVAVSTAPMGHSQALTIAARREVCTSRRVRESDVQALRILLER